MIKKTNTNTNTSTKKNKSTNKSEDTGGQRKRGRPRLENTLVSEVQEEVENHDEPLEEEKEVESKNTKKSKQEPVTGLQDRMEMDPEMMEMYKLLDKYDPTKIEKFNTVLSMYRQKPRVVNTITFKVLADVNLEVEYYNTTPEQLNSLFVDDTIILTNGIANKNGGQQLAESTSGSVSVMPLERYKLLLEYKDYNSRSELDRITKSQGARKFRNYVGNQVMEQFHRPLLGKLLNQFEELKQHIKYDSEEINLRFENFNFLGSTFIMMGALKYFVESGTVSMGRKNGFNANIVVTHTEYPTFKITFTK